MYFVNIEEIHPKKKVYKKNIKNIKKFAKKSVDVKLIKYAADLFKMKLAAEKKSIESLCSSYKLFKAQIQMIEQCNK